MSQFDLIRKLNSIEARVTELERKWNDEHSVPDLRDSLASQYQAKFGKKPHHFMSVARIKEALNGG